MRERQGLILEEGGWGKGAGLADAMAALAAAGVARATLDLGGQVAVSAPGRCRSPTRAGGTAPSLALSVDGGSVSTSGNSERGIEVAGEHLGHILDPRTGEPAPDFGSLTVWTADPLRADCLSTGLYVLGPERALAWAAAHPGVEVLVLRRSGSRLRALASRVCGGRLRSLDPEIEIEFGNLRRRPIHAFSERGSPLLAAVLLALFLAPAVFAQSTEDRVRRARAGGRAAQGGDRGGEERHPEGDARTASQRSSGGWRCWRARSRS